MVPARVIATYAIAAVTLLAPAPARAQEGQPAVGEFIGKLHLAATTGDRETIAEMIRFPVTANTSGVRVPVADRAAFLKLYDAVMTEPVRTAIAKANAALRGSGTDAYAVSKDGIVIGDQIVEARLIDGRYRITGFNVPAGGGPGGQPPRRAVARPGGPPAQFRGVLDRGARDTFIVAVQQGQLLSVRITEVKGRDIVARVTDVETGAPVDARAGQGSRAWSGRVPRAGDYKVEIAREGGGGGPLPYLVAIGVR